LEHQGELGKIRLLEEIYPTKPFGMEYVEGEGLYFICGLPCAEDGVPATSILPGSMTKVKSIWKSAAICFLSCGLCAERKTA